jgi:hypothetical protein
MNQRAEQKLAIENEKAAGAGAPHARGRKPYVPPRLQLLGDIRDLTMGGSPGVGDSGATSPEFPASWP